MMKFIVDYFGLIMQVIEVIVKINLKVGSKSGLYSGVHQDAPQSNVAGRCSCGLTRAVGLLIEMNLMLDLLNHFYFFVGAIQVRPVSLFDQGVERCDAASCCSQAIFWWQPGTTLVFSDL